MQNIGNFLRRSRRLLNNKDPICIVIGNESCDLDSAVSALTLAFFYGSFPEEALNCKNKRFLAVLNIHRCDYPLKTEVNFLLKKYGIKADVLTFRDEVCDELISRSEVILVDHHVTPFALRCVEVYDHRELDLTSRLLNTCKIQIEPVGSCASLIADKIHIHLPEDENNKSIFLPVAEMLRATIILDTANFDENAQRFKHTDKRMIDALEKYIGNKKESRKEIFESLVKARADISSLSIEDLLRKDMKIISNQDNSIRLALCGFPLLVRDFVEKCRTDCTVRNFAIKNRIDIVILIGMLVNNKGEIERDIGFINIQADDSLYTKIVNSLLESKDPDFELERRGGLSYMDGTFFKQNNITATRKHIMPIVGKAAGFRKFDSLEQ